MYVYMGKIVEPVFQTFVRPYFLIFTFTLLRQALLSNCARTIFSHTEQYFF